MTYNRRFPGNEEDRIGIQAHFSCPSGFIHHGTDQSFCSREGIWMNENQQSQNPVCIGKKNSQIKVEITGQRYDVLNYPLG